MACELLSALLAAVAAMRACLKACSEFSRRLNRLFDLYKEEMARRFGDVRWLFAEYETGLWGRLRHLWKLLGTACLCSHLLHKASWGRCESWDGAETRFSRRTWRDRSVTGPNPAARRFYDDPNVVARILAA